LADLRTWEGSLGPTMTDRDVARRDSVCLAIVWLTAFLAVGVMLMVSFVVDPVAVEDGRIRLTPQCSSQRWLGQPCPTCGLTLNTQSSTLATIALFASIGAKKTS
jgi:hypothetical protein